MTRLLKKILILCATPYLMAAENYISAHINQNPDIPIRFVCELPTYDCLTWQAWLHIHSGDFNKANACFYKLAELNQPQGYRGLADSYLAGQGLPQNTDLALVLYEKAAALGSGAAQVNAAILRADRCEWARAKTWFKQALNNPDTVSIHEELKRLYHKRMEGHL